MDNTVRRVAGTEIIVGGRQYKVEGEEVSYEQIIGIWNKLHAEEGQTIIGTPGIDYRNGDKGILMPGETTKVQDGMSFSVDPSHVS